MKKRVSCLAICLLALTGVWHGPGYQGKDSIGLYGQVLDRTVTNLEHEFVPAAEAMPEEKFEFAPTNGEFKGVRTFGEQVKHVAAVNYNFGAAILGEKLPVDIGRRIGPGLDHDKGRDSQVPERLFCIRAQGRADHQRQESSGDGKESVRRRKGDASGPGDERRSPWFRPLRTDGGIPAHERDRAAGQSADVDGSV